MFANKHMAEFVNDGVSEVLHLIHDPIGLAYKLLGLVEEIHCPVIDWL